MQDIRASSRTPAVRSTRRGRRARAPFPQTLARLALFRACSARELKMIARHSVTVPVPSGRVLIREGETPREFLAVLRGHAGVARAGQAETIISPNGWVGEVDLLARSVATATVTALSDLDLVVIERREFLALLDAIPGFRHQILASLARQVRLR